MSFTEHTVITPAWITTLVNDLLVDAFVPLGFIGPLGFRYWAPQEGGAWEVAVYPLPSEIRGSDKNDGNLFVSGFRLDLMKVLKALTDVEEVAWHSPARYNNDLDGPEISVRARFVGKPVNLRIFHMPPPDEPPAFAYNPQTREALELPA